MNNIPNNPDQGEPKNWEKRSLIAIVALAVLAAVIFLVPWGEFKTAAKDVTTSASADQEAFSNGVWQVSQLVEETSASMSSNLLQVSGEMSALVLSNQTMMLEMVEKLHIETASNNASIREEIPGIVGKEVAKAMEPYKRLLTLTNQPPTPVITMVTQFVTIPPLVATVTSASAVVTNSTVVINPPPQSQPQPVALVQTTTPAVVFQNNNTVVTSGLPPPPSQRSAKKSPYWWEWWEKQ